MPARVIVTRLVLHQAQALLAGWISLSPAHTQPFLSTNRKSFQQHAKYHIDIIPPLVGFSHRRERPREQHTHFPKAQFGLGLAAPPGMQRFKKTLE